MAVPQQKAPPNVGEILLQANLLTAEQLGRALDKASADHVRLEEALINNGIVSEGVLLKALSAHFKTQFVSSEKLAKAAVDKAILAMIPREAADALGVFPVMFDAKTNTLGVVTSDPSDTETLRNAQEVSQVRQIRAFVARARAVRSAIARAYAGELSAFAWMDLEAQGVIYGFEPVSSGQHARRAASVSPPAPPDAPFEVEQIQAPRLPVTKPAQVAVVAPTTVTAGKPGRARTDPGLMYGFDEVLEMMNVFVNLIESDRPDLRGHSSQVARLTKRVGEKMSVPNKVITSAVAAAYAHDLGKAGQFHLTALNVAEYDSHRVAAQGLVNTPTRLLKSVKLSAETAHCARAHVRALRRHRFPRQLRGRADPARRAGPRRDRHLRGSDAEPAQPLPQGAASG